MRLRSLIAGGLLAAPLCSTSPASAQTDYEAIYGPVQDVSLETLAMYPESYDQRAIRTTGRLQMLGIRSGHQLSAGITANVWLRPVREIEAQFEFAAPDYMGKRVEVVGLFQRNMDEFGERASVTGVMAGTLTFWEFMGPPEKVEGKVRAPAVSLESLVTSPGQRDSQMVRVVGQFRGRNLYRDLPSSSQRRSSDWVIKDDLFAVWVTGKRPRGDGFRLDPELKRDTGKWLEVVGRVTTRNGITYIDAADVRITDAPLRADAGADPEPTPTPRPRRAPVVVFSLPLDGEEIPRSTLFQVQFSKDMDERSFAGRVVLRYAGPRRPGDRLFDGVRLEYDGGLRALTVDPGDVLRPGREVQLLLLEGITDLEGLELEARPGVAVGEDEVADVLSYVVANEFVTR